MIVMKLNMYVKLDFLINECNSVLEILYKSKTVSVVLLAWDWTALDPAIVTSSQHCDLYTAPPPPGFPLRQTLDNL